MKRKLLFLTPMLIAAFLFCGGGGDGKKAPSGAELTDAEFQEANTVYFQRCGGCHGTLRKGATGKALTPDKTTQKSVDKLTDIIAKGTDGGMPGLATTGEITQAQAGLLAKYIQNEPVAPPEFNMKDIKATWKLHVPMDKRPKKPIHKRNLDNMFAVILRDAGKIGIIDGDTKEMFSVIDSGYAVHTLRYSASGRYLYTIGRDAKATIVDLWMDPPALVAEVKTGIEARSIDSSKYKGFEDKYAVVGNYWPPSYVMLDGLTLEPLKIVGTRGYTYDTNEYHPEPRVASIVASHHNPEWVLNVKEAGIVLLVDYSKLAQGTVTETRINAERFLHDGGWDHTKRYFLVAANMRDKVVVIDTKARTRAAIVETGVKPHPGRGANFKDPKFGWVYATPHLGEPNVALIGTDPGPNQWKVVRTLEPAGDGGLFLKTHPKSNNLWVDHPLAKDEKTHRSVSVFDIKNLDAPPKVITLGDRGRIVHFEYNKAGDEVWIALWDKKGEMIIMDDKTLKEKSRIKDAKMVTPTGKFNVYNTLHDIY
ncbi:MAG: nitrite reductase [Spirochaetia bacterium]|nr:nitrite reductase [Spirochaetia bacterium]